MAAARAAKSRNRSPPSDPQGMFSDMVVLLIETQVQTRRLQIWKQKLMQMGAVIADRLSNSVTHILALNSLLLTKQLDTQRLSTFKGDVVTYQWLEDSLKLGQKVAVDSYDLKLELKGNVHHQSSEEIDFDVAAFENSISSGEGLSQHKKIRPLPQDFKDINMDTSTNTTPSTASSTSKDTSYSCDIIARKSCPKALHMPDKQNSVDKLSSSMQYNPPDLNSNITDIFGKLVNIYRALGEERRSFSYHKAVGVIEKLPFKIESAEQVKELPSIGKSMKDHIQEIVSTGKLSKLEHFETDEKVKTISLFGDVWGIGPATALKLYEMGHRTLEDLMNEDSLTNAQRLGLKYFDDIKTRIPRHEVQEMELLLQKAGEDILPGVLVLCGGSFRRGNSSCGDLDVIITHPDGTSHKGFLPKYVKHLKDMRFVREDLIFSIHSEQGTDSGVDTYFGFCTYPCRELRHRIDLKVYPRDIYAFGLIAWTGNDVLNRRLRLLAESKGYRLDDTGLFLATQSSGSKRGLRASRSLSLKTEKEVFDYLGFPWLEPNERNL